MSAAPMILRTERTPLLSWSLFIVLMRLSAQTIHGKNQILRGLPLFRRLLPAVATMLIEPLDRREVLVEENDSCDGQPATGTGELAFVPSGGGLDELSVPC